ncbi:PREDICTED: testicular haploid expressed gene protein [Elephantulus edwardii]|uniref:testicular haploid expressed gene protein n=1 Tax=Elephantulus edwardii TaxID=28737 RepID=UPI0003F0EBCD|nr:PREDICTED: testicular haploid expressed gene protein [Elephantulus edwardii]
MGDYSLNLNSNNLASEAAAEVDKNEVDDTLDFGDPEYKGQDSVDLLDLNPQDEDDVQLELESPLKGEPEQEVTGTQDQDEILSHLQSVQDKDLEEGKMPEVSRLSISQELPVPRGKKKKRRIFDLARPKTNRQMLTDRVGCCQGYAWISPCKMTLHFSVFWPSIYWTERFLEDTTLSITVPEISARVEELARPKRFYSEYYNNNRTTPIWPIGRSTLEFQASNRLRELAAPKIRNNIWNISMSEMTQVSRAAQTATPSPRILQLAKPRPPATLLEEWDPMPKTKPHVSDNSRLLQLAMPKVLSEKCVPDRNPHWQVLDAAKKAVASPRIISLAKPRARKDLHEDYNRPRLASMSSPSPRASPEKCDWPGATRWEGRYVNRCLSAGEATGSQYFTTDISPGLQSAPNTSAPPPAKPDRGRPDPPARTYYAPARPGSAPACRSQ